MTNDGKILFPALGAMLFAFCVFFSGCAAMLATMPPIVDGSLELPGDRDLDYRLVELGIPPEQYSFLSRKDNILEWAKIDGKRSILSENIIIPPGKHTISAEYRTDVRETYSHIHYNLATANIEYDFEPGKFYNLSHTMAKNAAGSDVLTLHIEENSNVSGKLLEDIQKVKDFLASANASSANIDGTYSLETESHITRSTVVPFMTLEKNQIFLHSQPDPASTNGFSFGRFLINDKWIVVLPKENPRVPALDNPVLARYIREDNYLLVQAPYWKHTFPPYTLKYIKIK
jgi:hypothetical protein